MDALRPFNLAPGDYVAPLPESMAHMSSPEFKAKQARGPSFALTVLANTSMARNLVIWFVYSHRRRVVRGVRRGLAACRRARRT